MKLSSKTTAEQVLNHFNSRLTGRNIIVTGASSGIGVETARCLAKFGGNVWITGRNLEKLNEVAQSIIADCGDRDRVHVLQLDLASLSSVRQFCTEFLAQNYPLHILINNAGCMALNLREETADHFEMQFGTNHLGHFLLTELLLPALRMGGTAELPSRVVNVSSGAHRRSGVNFNDIQAVRSYDPWVAYGQSKTANILHAVEFDKRHRTTDNIMAVSLHPGVIDTGIFRHSGKLFKMDKTIEQGAATTIFCCVSPTVEGGKFYSDCKVASAEKYATNSTNALKLWKLSEELVFE